MRILFLFGIICTALADPRKTPRIYNVLITSEKDLSPSHAIPVYEPVLRTTSVGFAFPQIIYHPAYPQLLPFANYQPLPSAVQALQPIQPIPILPNVEAPKRDVQQKSNDEASKNQNPASAPLPVEQFIPYTPLGGSLISPERYYNQPEQLKHEETQTRTEEEDYRDIRIPVNFKNKNPEIPDVPPPPLPVKSRPK